MTSSFPAMKITSVIVLMLLSLSNLSIAQSVDFSDPEVEKVTILCTVDAHMSVESDSTKRYEFFYRWKVRHGAKQLDSVKMSVYQKENGDDPFGEERFEKVYEVELHVEDILLLDGILDAFRDGDTSFMTQVVTGRDWTVDFTFSSGTEVIHQESYSQAGDLLIFNFLDNKFKQRMNNKSLLINP